MNEDKDITNLVHEWRNAVRTLWNSFMRVGADWQTHEVFESIADDLFRAVVLRSIDQETFRKSQYQSYPFLHVVPGTSSVPVMVRRDPDGGNGYWDDPVTKIGPSASLTLIDIFDWDSLGFKEMQYWLVRIEGFPSSEQVVGRQALIETHYAQIIYRSPSINDVT